MLGLRPKGLPDSVFVHPLSFVEASDIGEETRIWNFAQVMKGARVGGHCNLGAHVFVESGAVIGNGVTVKNGVSLWNGVTVEDDVFVGPHAIFTNVLKPRAFRKTPPENFLPTILKRGATVGAGAIIVCGVTIGEFALVAAGAVVTRDVPAHALVAGNPARVKARVCQCGQARFAAESNETRCPRCAA